MSSELKLLNEIRLQSKTYTNHGITSSEDFQYCIIVEDGLYVLQLCGFMDNFMKTMSFTKQFIKTDDYLISSNLGIDINSFVNELPKHELYEAVLRLDVSEQLDDALMLKQQAVLAKWSPLGLVANNNCVLGVLSHTGSLSLLVYMTNQVEYENFIEVENISKTCLDYLKNKFFGDNYGDLPSETFEELKRRALIATPNTFTWSHLISENGNKYCLVLVGHLDGGITVCRVNAMNLNEVRCESVVIGYYRTGLKRLTSIHWQRADNNGLLIVGDLEGKTKVISVSDISWDSVNFESETWLWNQVDKVRVDYFKVIIYKKSTYIFIVKGTTLLICLIDEPGSLLDVYPCQIGNVQITGIEHYEKNIVLVLTYTGIVKEIKFSCENDKIQLELRNLFLDFKWWSHRTHGLIVSYNKVFIGILASPSKLTNIKKRKDHVRLLIFMNTAKNPLETVLSNDSNLLTMYWDCFEILRLNGLIEKKLPTDELPRELDYDKLSLVQLKTCFWLAKSSEMMHNKTQVFKKNAVIQFDEVKYILKIKLAVDHVHYLLELVANGGSLSEFHMQSLDIINMFLKETVLDGIIHKLGLGKITIDELYDVIIVANELQYPQPPECLWCGEHILLNNLFFFLYLQKFFLTILLILGLSCVPSHPDMRCQISYMPITKLPFYKCQFCKCVVHHKLSEVYKVVLCPYCDVSLKYISVLVDKCNSSIAPDEETNDFQNLRCYNDCLTEIVDSIDVEEQALINFSKTEVVDILSISSDENEVDEVDSTHLNVK